MRVDLRGMSAAEAEAAVADMIDEAQQVALRDFLLRCAGMGLTEDDLDREMAHQQAELASSCWPTFAASLLAEGDSCTRLGPFFLRPPWYGPE
jgi:hypothetical protein